MAMWFSGSVNHLEFPQTLELKRVVVVQDPEFIADSGGNKSRGYVPSIELWNNMTRVNVAFPATPLAVSQGTMQAFSLRTGNGEELKRMGATAGSDGLVSLHSLTFGPIPEGTQEVELRYAVTPIPVESWDAVNFVPLVRVSL